MLRSNCDQLVSHSIPVDVSQVASPRPSLPRRRAQHWRLYRRCSDVNASPSTPRILRQYIGLSALPSIDESLGNVPEGSRRMRGIPPYVQGYPTYCRNLESVRLYPAMGPQLLSTLPRGGLPTWRGVASTKATLTPLPRGPLSGGMCLSQVFIVPTLTILT